MNKKSISTKENDMNREQVEVERKQIVMHVTSNSAAFVIRNAKL